MSSALAKTWRCGCFYRSLVRKQSLVNSLRSITQVDPKIIMKELEKPRLPEDLAHYAGHVLYPNEESAKWDLEG